MKLQDFVEKKLRYDTTQIAQDAELSQNVKAFLMNLGLLIAPAEGSEFGAGETAALKRFQKMQGYDREPDFLGPQTAAKLIEVGSYRSRSVTKPLMIKTLRETLFKQIPIDDAEVERVGAPAGKELKVVFYEKIRGHLRVTLAYPLQGLMVWYVKEEDVSIVESDPAGGEVVYPPQLPEQVKLNVPYRSQRDNVHNPDGSCNVTSLAMCMAFFGGAAPQVQQQESTEQVEDQLYQYALNHGLSRHSPHDLAKILHNHGLGDRFSESATIDEVKGWLAQKKPAIVHGYFTQFGHIIVLVGYDKTGFIVHDPYGEWFPTGYDRNDPNGNDEKGKYKHYSYKLIQKTCIPADGSFWVHFVSKT